MVIEGTYKQNMAREWMINEWHLKCYAESAVKRKRIYRAGEVWAVYFEDWK